MRKYSKYSNIFCFSFEEILKTVNDTFLFDTPPSLVDCFGDNLQTLDTTYWGRRQTDNYGWNLWLLLYQNHYPDIIVYSKEETPTEKDKQEFFRRFYGKWAETHVKYDTLIKAYGDAKNNLLKTVDNETTREIKFNDTPQEANIGTTDEFLSNYTKETTTTKVNPSTLENRLEELDKVWKDIYNKWCKEFEGLFTSDLNFYEV